MNEKEYKKVLEILDRNYKELLNVVKKLYSDKKLSEFNRKSILTQEIFIECDLTVKDIGDM